MNMDTPPTLSKGSTRLTTAERVAIALVMTVAVAFGGMVLLRSAFQNQRKTDLDVFSRAAWAVRTGQDVYATYSDRSWNYLYPTFFAIVMTPLAEPPTARTFDLIYNERAAWGRVHGADESELALERQRLMRESDRLAALGLLREPGSGGAGGAGGAGYLPFWVSVASWYLASLGMVMLSAHWIGASVQSADRKMRAWTSRDRGWWMLRIWPVIFCAPAIFNGLSRGQSDALVLLSIAAFLRLSSSTPPRRMLAGLALAVAPAVKVIPGLLILYPLWRRDARTLVGIALGGGLTLLVIPAMVFGPARAMDYNLRWLHVMGLPGLGLAGENADASRKFELYGLSGTDSQNLLSVLHNIMNIGTPRGLRPDDPASWLPLLVIVACGAAVALSLWAMRWRPVEPGASLLSPARDADPLLVPSVGVLLCVMLMVSPVTHAHYFAFLLPLMAWLVSLDVRRHLSQGVSRGTLALGLAYLTLHVLARLNVFEWMLDVGVLLWVGVGIWMYACVRMRQEGESLRYA